MAIVRAIAPQATLLLLQAAAAFCPWPIGISCGLADASSAHRPSSPRCIVGCSYVGQTQRPRFVAFYGCMYYALMRPSEVAALTTADCYLPDNGWGHLTFADSRRWSE